MSVYEVVLAPAAESDVATALLWYRERNALAADAFRTEVFDAVEAVARAPLRALADDDGNRRRVLRRFPYSIHYVVRGRTITILAVAHHRRSPDYWQTRQP